MLIPLIGMLRRADACEHLATSHAAVITSLGYDVGSALTSLQVLSGTALTHNDIYTSTATGARSAVSDTLSAAHASYRYDQADRLIGYDAGFGPFSYGYDGDGLRQSKALSGTTEAYTWDTAEGLPQLLQDAGTRYVMGPEGLPLEQVSVMGTVLYVAQRFRRLSRRAAAAVPPRARPG